MLIVLVIYVRPSFADNNHLEAFLGTRVPLYVGAGLNYEITKNYGLHATAGYMPDSYFNLINSTAERMGFYSSSTAQLIETALNDTSFIGVGADWKPWGPDRFYFSIDYQFGWAQGGLAPLDLLESALDRKIQLESQGEYANSLLTYSLESRIHMIGLSINRKWYSGKHIVIKTGLGIQVTVNSITEVRSEIAPLQGGISRDVEDLLDDALEKYAHTIIFDLSVGFRFF